MYMTDHIFTVLPIKQLLNKDGKKKCATKMATDMKLSLLNPRVLLCPCVVKKSTSNVYTKALNIRHQPQKGFWGIFV